MPPSTTLTTRAPSAQCPSNYAWLSNRQQQDPCAIANVVLSLPQCLKNGNSGNIPPSGAGYPAPDSTLDTACSCSWVFYNLIQACSECQGGPSNSWASWSGGACTTDSFVDSSQYWPSNVPFSNSTAFPQWSIVNPTSWNVQTFNIPQAQVVAKQQGPDATDTSLGQPDLRSSTAPPPPPQSTNKSTPIGAIVGGVIGGLALLLGALVAYWYFYKRPRQEDTNVRQSVDLAGGEFRPQDHYYAQPVTPPPHGHGTTSTQDQQRMSQYGSEAYLTSSVMRQVAMSATPSVSSAPSTLAHNQTPSVVDASFRSSIQITPQRPQSMVVTPLSPATITNTPSNTSATTAAPTPPAPAAGSGLFTPEKKKPYQKSRSIRKGKLFSRSMDYDNDGRSEVSSADWMSTARPLSDMDIRAAEIGSPVTTPASTIGGRPSVRASMPVMPMPYVGARVPNARDRQEPPPSYTMES